MTERTLGMGVIGCGGVAHGAHLPNIIRNPRAKLVAVADIDLDRGRVTFEQYGGTANGDCRELLTR